MNRPNAHNTTKQPKQTNKTNTNDSLVHFGRFAGMAGTIDALQALGQNLLARGFNTPFLHSPAAYMYVRPVVVTSSACV